MPIPQLSPEERKAALEKAKAARIQRAQVRDDLKSGKLTLKQVLDMKDDPVVGRMRVSTLIETMPGYGKAKAEKVMNRAPHRREPPSARFGRAPGSGAAWSAWANAARKPSRSLWSGRRRQGHPCLAPVGPRF